MFLFISILFFIEGSPNSAGQEHTRFQSQSKQIVIDPPNANQNRSPPITPKRSTPMSKPHENLLSLFLSSSPKSPKSPSEPKKSPLNFDSRVVGLGIVAAMNDTRDAKPPVSPKSEPIPIVSGRSDTKCRRPVSEMELSESYTCVISRIGCESEQRREYFGDGMGCNHWEKSGVFWECSPAAAEAVQVVEFLSCCYLCRKKLIGLDVFMYRGDKGFCSAECRCQQMLNDEQREKCGPEALKRFHCSVSSCSGPRLFSAGVVAA